MTKRKCCDTPKGSGPHAPDCRQGKQLKVAMRDVSKEGRKAAFLDAADGLPDGAFWALADEFGLEPGDFAE